MKWNKQLRTCAVGLALLMALPGCQSPANTPSSSEGHISQTDPTHFFEEVQPDLLIDAHVDNIPEGVTLNIYEGLKPNLSKEAVDAFMSQTNNSILSVNIDEVTDDIYHYQVGCENGGRLGLNVSQVPGECYGEFSYTNQGDKWYNDLVCWYGGDGKVTYAATDNTAQFEEPVAFSFATEQEAEKQVRAALAALGVKDVVLTRTLYLSHERLQAVETHRSENPDMVRGDILEEKKDVWSEADDCYMFVFSSGKDGIQTIDNVFLRSTYGYGGTTILARYNASGLTHLQGSGMWNFGGIEENIPNVLSASEAMEIAKESLTGTVLPHHVVFDRISIRYRYEQDGDRWLLRPVWEVAVRMLDAGGGYQGIPSHDTYEYIHIDALTGEEI